MLKEAELPRLARFDFMENILQRHDTSRLTLIDKPLLQSPGWEQLSKPFLKQSHSRRNFLLSNYQITWQV